MNSVQQRPEPPLIEASPAQRVFADGCKVVVDDKRVHYVYYLNSVKIDDDFPTERRVECVVTIPLDAVMPIVRQTLAQLGSSGIIMAEEGQVFWTR